MDEVERLFHKLVDVLADHYPDRLSEPLEASEIYRRFIPYRRFRSVLKFDTNQDYEMALLSFLAGKHGFASVEPPEARDELAAEAESINPNPSLIREYAAVRVYLNSNEVTKCLDRREPYAQPDDEEPEESEKADDHDDEGVTDSADVEEPELDQFERWGWDEPAVKETESAFELSSEEQTGASPGPETGPEPELDAGLVVLLLEH